MGLFSLEWFMEFYWDLTYWMIYRYYAIFHVPTTGVFIYTMCFHLVTEFFAVFGRLTEKYYKTSRYLVHRWTPRNCLDHIQDDCTYAEWRNRLAMDIVVKFGVSIGTGVFFLVNIAVNLPLYLGDGADADSDFE